MNGGRILVRFDDLGDRGKDKPGVPVKVSVSNCQTRSMTMSVARIDLAINPPERALLILNCLPASLTRTVSKQTLSERKQGLPVAWRKAASTSWRLSHNCSPASISPPVARRPAAVQRPDRGVTSGRTPARGRGPRGSSRPIARCSSRSTDSPPQSTGCAVSPRDRAIICAKRRNGLSSEDWAAVSKALPPARRRPGRRVAGGSRTSQDCSRHLNIRTPRLS